ncbi:hypothetical protein PR048_031160 [Dryococelus australis]|uniref:Uncharacterized protein n=1 Tax=Dryococelus australis TaxID=614101 RepID=A0ABQ9G8J4_9NEOP|nr:hypothetical protein PR048_031160 [Dryococelus australis]
MESLAESELLKASAEVSRTVKALEEQTCAFEKRKLRDVRSLLLDFITVEMSLHAKSLELFTRAYQDVAAVDEDADLQVIDLLTVFLHNLSLHGTHWL